LPIQGQIFRVLGVNMGQISIFHFITPKRHILARFRVFWAMARQNPSRGLFSTLVWEKIKKSHKKLYFTPLPRSDRDQIFTKFGTNVPLVDVINPDKLCVSICSRVSILQGSKFPFFPQETDVAVISAALLRSLWLLFKENQCFNNAFNIWLPCCMAG